MVNQKFEVKGTFQVGNEVRPYKKVVEASSEKQAIERIYTLIGSKHRLKRNYITIQGVSVFDGE